MITKIYRALVLLIFISLFSCIKEAPDTRLEVEVKNMTNEHVILLIPLKYSIPGVSDTTYIDILPDATYKWTAVSRGGSDQYPMRLQVGFPPGDSLQVIFNDTLIVTHFTNLAGHNSTHIDSSVIEYNEPRNIYNPNNYSKEKLGENYFRGTYIITESDLDYALSIHE